MVTNAAKPESTPKVFIHPRVEAAARVLIAGHEVGAVRRITLYIVAVVAVFAAVCLAAPWSGVAGAAGLVALLLLGLTDQLR